MKTPIWLRVVIWTLVVAIGVTSIGVLALSRGEHISALWMVVAAVCVFAVSYRFHSAWLMAKVLTLDEMRATRQDILPGTSVLDLRLGAW